MISIFFGFLKHEKDAIFLSFYKNMLGNFLGFGRMHENKIFLSFFFCLLKREINLNILRFFLIFF
jgi:hypothetical protein